MISLALEYKTLVFRKENCPKWKVCRFFVVLLQNIFAHVYIYVYTSCSHHGHLIIVSSEASSAIPYFSILSHILHDFPENFVRIKYIFRFFL